MIDLSRRHFLTLSAASTLAGLGRPANAQSQSPMFDAIIIGAGLSGLCAAHRLVQRGVSNILILEARDRLGGRIVNQRAEGLDLEAGGQWVGPSQTQMIGLADAFGVERYPTHLSGDALIRWMRQTHQITQQELFAQSAATRQAIELLDRTADSVPVAAPWDHPEADKLDRLSVAQWAKQFGLSDEPTQELLTETIDALGGSMSMSALDYLWSVKACGGHDAINNFEGGAQQSRFIGGPTAIIDRLGADLHEHVRIGAPVSAVEYEDNGVLVRVRGMELKARRCVLALSPTDMQRIQFTPQLPPARRNLNQGWRMEPGFKAHVIYETPFWRDKGLSGLALGQTLVEASLDNTPLRTENGHGALLLFLGKSAAAMSPSKRYDAVLKELRSFFGRDANKAVNYLEMNWADEPWSGGCTSPLPPGVLSKYGAALFKPVGPIHFAGTEAATVWRGYMEGAVRSGMRAAEEVIQFSSREPDVLVDAERM